jgi:hypothetical protein
VNSSRGVVRVRVAATVAGLTLALAGCSYTSPPDVLKVTDPGDGRSGAIGGDAGNGGVKLRNFLVVSDGSGKPGTLVGAVSNETTGPAQVTLTVVATDQSGQQTPVGSTNVSLKPSEFVQFGSPAGATTSPAAASAATPSTSAAQSVGSSASYTPTPPPSGDTNASGPATGRVIEYQIPTVPERSGEVIQLVARTAQGGATINMPILPPVGEYAHLAPSAGSSATSSPSPTSSPEQSSSPSVDPSGAATQSPSGTASPSS